MTQTDNQRLDRIERMLSQVLKLSREQIVKTNESRAPKWVKISVFREATGWDAKMVRKCRETGVIGCRKKNGIEYDLNSIPEVLKKI